MALATVAAAGDLTGNWSWSVWLLIPGALILALVTALAMGPGGDPTPSRRGAGGVSQYLERRAGETSAASRANREDDR